MDQTQNAPVPENIPAQPAPQLQANAGEIAQAAQTGPPAPHLAQIINSPPPVAADLPAKPRSRKRIYIGAVLVFVILLLAAAGAYAFYTGVFVNPSAVWNTFVANKTEPVYSNNFSVTYTDTGAVNATGSLSSILAFKNLQLKFDGTFYADNTNAANPSASSTISYSFQNGGVGANFGLNYFLKDRVAYVNVGSNPLLQAIINSSGNTNYDWLKIDLNALQQMQSQDSGTASTVREFLAPSLRDNLQKIWDNTHLVKFDNSLGRETINGIPVLHFKNSIDKAAIKTLFSQYITTLNQALSGNNKLDADKTAAVNATISALVDKIQVQTFETWVGAKDFRLYKVKFVSNAPSLASLVNAGQQSYNLLGGTSSEDSKRLADIRQMSTALELYYNDKKGYPDAKNGQPIGLTPTYIGLLPVAPAASGTCSAYYNTYWYTPIGVPTKQKDGTVTYTSYTLTFCLGSDIGGYKAGTAEVTPQGIQNIPCPGTPDQCVSPAAAASAAQTLQQKAVDFVNKLSFSAQMEVDSTYFDYGKTENLVVPTNPYDLVQMLMGAQGKSRDAKRLADVRQMMVALELYANDHNFSTYPPSLSELVPTYIGMIPTAPEPADGTCTTGTNMYQYQLDGKNGYQLNFCLGSATQGYSAGKHAASPAGIQ